MIRRLSDDYAVLSGVCTSHRTMLDRLQSLEADVHVNKDNTVLFPDAEEAIASG